jgi:nitrogen-specific signal transduction histidine kinase
MAEDVTEQRKLEGQLRQAQKMEAIGQLTGGIAHDFNNELLVILLNAQMLSDSIEQGEAPRLDELGDITAAAYRASQMTQQLVGFSRRATLKPVPTDLARRAKKLSEMLARILPANIRMRTEADVSVESVLVDPNSVEQMLLNLVTNARYAMPDGGELNVRVWDEDLDEEYCRGHAPTVPGRYVLVSVTDTGVGMDEGTKAKIFEPFFTTKPVGKGTGLGMAMVYGLTKQQKGFVHVESELGRGTTVRLAFPVVADPASTTAEHKVPTAVKGGTETILFVDDEQALRRAGRRVLESQGYTVVTACDGVDALTNLRSTQFEVDLIITDLMMPNMNGAELCTALEAEGISVPVIIASGYSDLDVQAQLNTKVDIPIVRKPWTVTEMLAAVRDVLDRA